MKGWLADRVAWIDGNFTRPPTFSRDGGPIEPGFSLAMTAPSGTIYYTLTGEDPRVPGGSTLAGATVYSAPVTLTQNTRVLARAKVGLELERDRQGHLLYDEARHGRERSHVPPRRPAGRQPLQR